MMKYLSLGIVLAVLTCTQAKAQHNKWCITDEIHVEQLKNDPQMYLRMQQFNDLIKAVQEGKTKANAEDVDQVIKIPVVFHVFHENGNENISRTQILDQIRILNEDFRRLNKDSVNTNPVFKDVAADFKVEFELAKLDPNGRCTDGVVRMYTRYTSNADDNIKRLSVWPNNRYLNVWVVKNIKDRGDAGTILGYAQFPWAINGKQSSVTDGVIIRHDYIGSVGTSNAARAGRVATHEIGHWLGLFHPFQGGCEQGDDVLDTPPVDEASYGCNQINSCTNDNPDLPDQIENFMDYADGSCQNMFTKGQKARSRQVLFINREDLWKESNLVATGLVGQSAQVCALVPVGAAFCSNNYPCEGTSITFRDISYNTTVTSRTWLFEGGTPATSTAVNPVVQYSTSGKYDVTLIVSNANGTDTVWYNDLVMVSSATAVVKAPYAESFENTSLAIEAWYSIATGPNQWAISGLASYGNNKSIRVRNNFGQNGNIHTLISPAISTSGLSPVVLGFAYAYANKTGSFIGDVTAPNDRLTVTVSTDCGNTWTNIWSRTGAQLSTITGTINPEVDFVPTGPEMWKTAAVPVALASNQPSLLFRFDFQSDGGTNFYLDDITISNTGTLSTCKEIKSKPLSVYPNPAQNEVSLTTEAPLKEVTCTDILGRKVTADWKVNGPEGALLNTADLANGVYFIQATDEAGQLYSAKIVIKK
ncbi:MAG: T9SS type A sorting domain-containing protein [Bacteroidia bacterium]|nr:T9SS type A sorting domain-containing protein [Bacteroidia bacterium]MBP7262424.1 T9SS type A sorting domain-containing protein [Bacteroidia bacterium]MBP9180040.1 T9SS type A sorting domain-containing protein [Bacteroidia bacterium]MBP9725778.1 T9SS type A sorting domain-containing protein [Bacteroidia bacterium]